VSRVGWTITLCSFASFFDGYDIQSLGLALPSMAQYFGIAPHALGIAVSLSLVGTALGAMLLGPLGDRYSPKVILAVCLVLVGITSAGAASAATPLALAIWRFFCGLGMGAIVPVAITLVAGVAPAAARTALITVMVACQPVGSLCAGFLSPVIEPGFGWQGIFIFGAAATLSAGILVAATMPKPAVAPAVARGISVRSLFGPALLTVTLLLWAIFCLNLFVTASLISWLPTLLVESGWPRPDAQRATGLLAFGAIIGSLIFSWLIDRGLLAQTLVPCFVGTAVLFIFFAVDPSSREVWLMLITLVGAGCIGGQMALGSFSAGLYPPQIRNTGVGWSSGVGRLGSIIGPLIMAILLARDVAPPLILALLVVPMLLCGVGVLLLTKSMGRPSCGA